MITRTIKRWWWQEQQEGNAFWLCGNRRWFVVSATSLFQKAKVTSRPLLLRSAVPATAVWCQERTKLEDVTQRVLLDSTAKSDFENILLEAVDEYKIIYGKVTCENLNSSDFDDKPSTLVGFQKLMLTSPADTTWHQQQEQDQHRPEERKRKSEIFRSINEITASSCQPPRQQDRQTTPSIIQQQFSIR